MSVFDSFAPLDELIQVIYQGAHRFVVLSNIEFGPLNSGWDLHIGLADEGRWWKGRWSEGDVEQIAGSTSSATLLEAFAEKLAGTIVNGELYIADWNPDEEGGKMKIVFGTSAKRAMSMNLYEMDSRSASVYAISTLFSIGLAAQSRKCQLNPSSSNAIPSYSTTASIPETSRKNVSPPKVSPTAPSNKVDEEKKREKTSSLSTKEAEEEIKALRAQLVDAQRGTKTDTDGVNSSNNKESKLKASAPVAKTAVPRKKARRFKEMEFDDDD